MREKRKKDTYCQLQRLCPITGKPSWSNHGTSLFFQKHAKMMAVNITAISATRFPTCLTREIPLNLTFQSSARPHCTPLQSSPPAIGLFQQLNMAESIPAACDQVSHVMQLRRHTEHSTRSQQNFPHDTVKRWGRGFMLW